MLEQIFARLLSSLHPDGESITHSFFERTDQAAMGGCVVRVMVHMLQSSVHR